MRTRVVSLLAVAALSTALPSVASAQSGAPRMFTDPEAPGHGGFTVVPPTAPLLMAFHTCVSDCTTPRNHMIRFAQSADGASWTEIAGWQAYSGSVPDVFRRGDTVYVVGTGVSKIDLRKGLVTAHRISTKRAGGSNAMPRDVSFAGQLDDGRLVIVYVPPMSEVSPDAPQFRVHLAVEKAGSDGTAFEWAADALTIDRSALMVQGEPTDPDIFWNGSTWVLYVSVGSNVLAFTAPTLLGPYSPATQSVVSRDQGGVPSGILAPDGTVMSFVNFGDFRSATVSIRRAVSANGLSGLGTFAEVLAAGPLGATTAESPGVSLNSPGKPCGAGCGSSATVRAGAACSSVGQRATVGKRTLTCRKVGKRLVWR
jgi:hypothetical protein